ncbi:MAG: ABC transporter permease [Alkalispirochaeta sp.]
MRLRAVVSKEFRQILRDRRTLGLVIFLPLFLLVMFGYAVSLDVRSARLGIVDLDRTSVSRRVISAFVHNPRYFDVREYSDSATHLYDRILRGELQGGVVISRGFYREVLAGRQPSVQILVDGTHGTIASALQGYMVSVISTVVTPADGGIRYNGGTTVESPDGAGGIDLRMRMWFNPELESNKYLIPGLVAFILVITAVISTTLSIVREKELGTMEQLKVSPIRPVELILGKTIPYTVISVTISVAIFVAGYLLFGVGVAGSVVALAGATLLFLVASLGMGIFISSIADTQQVAFLIAILVTFLPAFILSGFVFPIDNMPLLIQMVTYLVPARYYIAALRTIMLAGGGVEAYGRDLLFLAGFGVVMITAGVVRLRRRGDL